MRTFDSGATRDSDDGKISYGGFLSPAVLQRFGEYMRQHQVQADGQRREAANWKKGILREAYLESLLRHVMDVWMLASCEGQPTTEDPQDALCAVLFNAQGLLYELLRKDEPLTAHDFEGLMERLS